MNLSNRTLFTRNTLTLLGLGAALASVAQAKPEAAFFVRCDRSTTSAAAGLDLSGLEIAASSTVLSGAPDGLLIEGLVLDVDPATAILDTALVASGTVWLEDQVMTVWSTDANGRTVAQELELSVMLEASEVWLSTVSSPTGGVEVVADILFDMDAVGTDGTALAGDAEITLKLATMATGAWVLVPDLSFEKIEPEEID